MKTGYLRKTQLYIVVISFIAIANGLLMHYNYQEVLKDIQNQKLSQAYQHQLRNLEDAILERSALYKQYIVNRKSKITLADLQLTEQKIKTILSRLTTASSGMIWDEPIKKLMDINQQFTSGATELVRSLSTAKHLKTTENLLLEDTQKFAEQIDQLDLLLKNYIVQLRQISDDATQASAQEVYKQNQVFILINLISCLVMISLLVTIYFLIGYRLRRSIINIKHALKDYSLFGASIPVFKQDRDSEIGQLAAAAQSFRDNVVENVIVHLRESHPALFKEVEHIIITSKSLKTTVNEILDVYDDNELKTKDILQSNEQTRSTLRNIIKNGEGFLAIAKESNFVNKNKKILPHIKQLEALIEQAHKAVVKEQNTAKRMATLAKIELKQKRIFELLLELSVKMGFVAEQLEKELSDFIHSSSDGEENVIINRR